MFKKGVLTGVGSFGKSQASVVGPVVYLLGFRQVFLLLRGPVGVSEVVQGRG